MPFVKERFVVKQKIKAFLFLIKELGLTQSEAQRDIARGRMFIDGVAMSNSSAFIEGEIEYVYFKPISRGLEPIFEHKDFAIYHKPSGVLVHPQNRHTPYSMIDEIKSKFGKDANITHRIDLETSGLLLASKNKESEKILKMLFEKRDIKKSYLAYVHGYVSHETFIDEPLLRYNDTSLEVRNVVRVDQKGKSSQTTITPLKYFQDRDITLVKAEPRTGRQHQIRVHLFHMKHPIVGDPIYGVSEEMRVKYFDRTISEDERLSSSGAKRLMLQAQELNFIYKNEEFNISTDVKFEL